MSTSIEKIVADLDAVVSEIFELMMGTHCVPLRFVSVDDAGAEVRFGTPWYGSCTVLLSDADAAAILQQMLGTGAASVDNDMRADAVRELCNMVAGGWKSRQIGKQGSMTPPRTVAAEAHRSSSQVHAPWAVKRSYCGPECRMSVVLDVMMQGAEQTRA